MTLSRVMLACLLGAPLALSVPVTYAQEARVVAQTGPVTLEQVLSEAKTQHPQFKRLNAELKAANARIDATESALRPYVGASADIGVGAAPLREFDDPAASTSVGLSASWLLWDFGKTSASVRASKAGILAQQAYLRASERDILLATEETFYTALATQELVEVARVNYEAEQRHLAEAERFVKAGQRAQIEVARARTQEARARTEFVRAQTSARQALVALGQAMGRTVPPASVVGTWPSNAPVPNEVGQNVDAALDTRPEMEALRARVVAAQEAVDAASLGRAPSISAAASLGYGSQDSFENWDPRWSAGVNLTWPFYDGGRTSALTEAARADLEAARGSVEEFTYNVAAQVQLQEVALMTAAAQVDAAKAAYEAAEIELRLAEARWREGMGSSVELADAQTRLMTTNAEKISAELARALAWARLQRAMGR